MNQTTQHPLLRLTAQLSLSLILVAGVACTTPDNKPQGNIQLPGWVITPEVKDGLAESACVPWSGFLSIDKEQATAIARNALVRQIELKAANMTKTYARKTDTISGSNVGANFESSARQIAEATLIGSKATKLDSFDIDGKKQLCVMVALPADATQKTFKQLVNKSGAKLNAKDEGVLYEEFRAYKAQQELEKILNKN